MTWNEDSTEDLADISRLQLLFDSEDPSIMAQRIAEAHQLRQKYESYIRYCLFVDNMPTDDIPPIGNEQINRILQSALSRKNEGLIDASSLLEEINIDWQHTMCKIIFDQNLESDQFTKLRNSDDLKHLDIRLLMSDKERAGYIPRIGTIDIVPYNYPKIFQNFCFHSFFSQPSAIAALKGIQLELLKLFEIDIFKTKTCERNLRLEDFEQIQTSSINVATNYIKRNWVSSIKNCIVSSLRESGKGWFNLRERNREVYSFSKLKKLLSTVNFKMEDTLRTVIENSLTKFKDLIVEACSARIDIRGLSDYTVEWDIEDEEPVPLFSLDIVIQDNKIAPVIPLEQFVETPSHLFQKILTSLQMMQQIESIVMEPLFSKGGEIPIMSSVQLYVYKKCMMYQ